MLVKIGENAKSLDDVDHGMMCLTLDNYAYTSPGMKIIKKTLKILVKFLIYFCFRHEFMF